MTNPTVTVLSVRGDALLEVAPDLATMNCTLRVFASSKSEALRVAAAKFDAVLADLREMGGSALTAGQPRQPLSWTARSATTHVETQWRQKVEQPVPTGRIIAAVQLRIELREFGLADAVGAALATHEDIHVDGVQWSVDADNPTWPQVRAAAIDAAIQKGRDYAAALGGSLERIEHVADVGLLGGGGANEMHAVLQSARSARSLDYSTDESGDVPSLDPVPQELQAVIEARFTASVPPIT